MPSSPCLRCGALVADVGASYCPRCEPERPSRQTAGRGTSTQAQAFRAEVLRRAGYRCEVVVGGERCEVRGEADLEAHHVRAITAGGDAKSPENGRAVCRRHHGLLDSAGRAR